MSFDRAYKETMGNEGSYVFDPIDHGGETYRGISRRYNPQWEGWMIIDAYDKPIIDVGALNKDTMLIGMTRDFYSYNYYKKPNFHLIEEISEKLAEKMFDTGVNVGVGRVSKWLQSSLNLLNRNAKYYPDIKVDGSIGPKTIKTLEVALKNNPTNRILTVLAIHQGEHYKTIMENDKTQERFVGWFDRLTYI